jgi:hypothetical protein
MAEQYSHAGAPRSGESVLLTVPVERWVETADDLLPPEPGPAGSGQPDSTVWRRSHVVLTTADAETTNA